MDVKNQTSKSAFGAALIIVGAFSIMFGLLSFDQNAEASLLNLSPLLAQGGIPFAANPQPVTTITYFDMTSKLMPSLGLSSILLGVFMRSKN
jgi:hypothetical protein